MTYLNMRLDGVGYKSNTQWMFECWDRLISKDKEDLINELYMASEEDIEFDRADLPFADSKYDSLRKDKMVVKLVV